MRKLYYKGYIEGQRKWRTLCTKHIILNGDKAEVEYTLYLLHNIHIYYIYIMVIPIAL